MQHFALVALTIGFVRCDGFQYDPQQKWHLSTPRSLTQNINAQSPSKNTYSTNLQRLMDEDSKPGGYGKSAPSAPNPSLTSSNSFGRSLTPAVDRRNAAPRGGSRRRVLTPNRRKATKPSVPGAGTKLEPAVATAYQPVKNIWIPKATPSINFDGSSKPKATAPSDHNDDPKSTETSLTNFSSGLMPKSVSLKTPIYRTNWMMLNLAKTAVPNVGPALTSQNFYSTNHSKIIPVAHILPPNSQKDRVTMTSESLGNTRSTPDKVRLIIII